MLAEAARDAIVWVDKSRRQAVRAPKPEALESLASAIGSQFNVRLAKALRARTVLFVEGRDMKVIALLARAAGATKLSNETGLAVIPLEGFSNWEHIEPFKWFLDEFLIQSVKAFVVLDRDYRPQSAVDDINAKLTNLGIESHVWARKELESYLMAPAVIARLSGASLSDVEDALARLAESMRGQVFARALEEEQQHQVSAKRHRVSVTQAFSAEFDASWKEPTFRLKVCPPKDLLRGLNEFLSSEGHRPVSARSLARALRETDLDREVLDLLRSIEQTL